MAKSNLHKLSERGVSVWIDSLSRTMLETGELERLIKEDAVVGETTNPTIFEKAISSGEAYDEQLRELLEEETDPKEIFLQLSARDVEAALDVFAKVHEGQPQDGFVTWEEHQCDAHLLAAALQRSRRGVSPRARAACRIGRRPFEGALGRELLRLA